MIIKEVTNLNDGVIYFKDDKIFEGDIATKECFDALYNLGMSSPQALKAMQSYVDEFFADVDVNTLSIDEIAEYFHEILANDFVNNEYDEESGFNTFGDSIKGGLEWFMADEEVYENCKTIKENDYSETDEFTLIKEMNHWIKQLKNFFVDDKKAQKAIADYFYYDDGKHQEDFKELQSSVKTLHKLWLKLDNIVEEAEEKEYNKSKNESLTIKEQSANIEVENPGILEVPEGKNVEDLPIKHFVALADKKGLSTITRALNNLQVWNKNKNPKLSKWAEDMIDKVTKRFENQKKESISRLYVKEEYTGGTYEDDYTYRLEKELSRIKSVEKLRHKLEIKGFTETDSMDYNMYDNYYGDDMSFDTWEKKESDSNVVVEFYYDEKYRIVEVRVWKSYDGVNTFLPDNYKESFKLNRKKNRG